MKNILIPTDFSACATYAVKAAFNLAERYGATIHLYSQIDIRNDWFNLSEEDKQNYPHDLQIIHNTELLFNEWKQKAHEKNIIIKTSWSGGLLIGNIKNIIKGHDIDFIVMGSHGASGKNEYLIGSNTQKVVRSVFCPVLVIKNDVSDLVIENVVFASNFDPDEKAVFQYFLDFVTPFQPTIHLVQVNTSSWFGQPYVLIKELMNDFKSMCGELKCETHFYRDWSVDAGIRHISETINADFVAISNQNRHPLKRLFAGSNVEALVNHADIPVLSIDLTLAAAKDQPSIEKKQQLNDSA